MKLLAKMSERNRGSQYKNIIVLLAIFSLSACANMTEQEKIYWQDMGIGAGGAAAAGTLLYKKDPLLGAVIGGGAGLAAGYGVARWQTNNINRIDRRSGQRKNVISGLQQQNAVMVRYNDRLRGTISQYERDIKRNIDRRRLAGEELRKAQNAYNDLLPVLARERQAAAQTPNPNQRRIYQNQLRQLEGEIQKLDRSIRRLKNICYGRVG